MASKGNFLPIEEVFKMRYLEQYVQQVVAYSSRYNNQNSYSYAPINLIGKYVKYPMYGDFPEAFMMRSYGKWWKTGQIIQNNYRPQDFDLLGAEDFVILEFGTPVVPRDIFIYEVYNPGAVIRLWGKQKCSLKWHLLWEGFPQTCGPRSRKFSPPLRKINCFIELLRIEFNQSHLDYHTAIDAVLLCGHAAESYFDYELIRRNLIEVKTVKTVTGPRVKDLFKKTEDVGRSFDYFAVLPNEILLNIFHYLDLKSLSRCAQVNRRWYSLTQDQTLYQNISLKTYWHIVNAETLDYFLHRIRNVKKLDLSWCNEYQNNFSQRLRYDYHCSLQGIIAGASKTLTHLSLNDNYFVDFDVMEKISLCEGLTELRLHNTYTWIRSNLDKLTKLVTLDLSSTNINDQDLIQILFNNPNLEQLIVDLCERLVLLDRIVETVTVCNKKLKTWSSWKAFSFTCEGIRHFAKCQDLEELDLGWCLISRDPGDCLIDIAAGCKKLRRLVLSEWRGLSDQLLMPIILSCKELSQIDLMGIKTISSEVCGKALFLLPRLRLLDISYCDGVRSEEVDIWRQQYPHISIQRSCESTVPDFYMLN